MMRSVYEIDLRSSRRRIFHWRNSARNRRTDSSHREALPHFYSEIRSYQKQTEELKAELLAEIRNEHKEALADIESRVREQMPHTILTKAIELRFEQLVDRLSTEPHPLKKLSNLNLVIGIGTELIGLVALGFITFTITTSVATSQSDLKDVGAMILTSYLPKLSLVS